MNLYEYQAKKILSKYGIPIPFGISCFSLSEVEKVLSKIKSPWAAKCQIKSGNRGKSGGIYINNKKNHILSFAKKWIGNFLSTNQTNTIGEKVFSILIEEALKIKKELYISILVDYNTFCIKFISSSYGGVNIEKNVKKEPNLVHTIFLDSSFNIETDEIRKTGFKLGLYKKQIEEFINICKKLIYIFLKNDLLLLEINPLVVTEENKLVCLDSKIIVDENALFRQKKLFDFIKKQEKNLLNNNLNINYVELKGNIGCIVNGAGLAMYTMDLIKFYGGNPANFLDIGGNTTKTKIIKSFEIILFKKSVNSILINIFGGIVRCDLVAESIIEAIQKLKINLPIIVRLEGNQVNLGLKKIKESNLNNIFIKNNIEDATKYTVLISKKGNLCQS